jgi:hypothetical protein
VVDWSAFGAGWVAARSRVRPGLGAEQHERIAAGRRVVRGEPIEGFLGVARRLVVRMMVGDGGVRQDRLIGFVLFLVELTELEQGVARPRRCPGSG